MTIGKDTHDTSNKGNNVGEDLSPVRSNTVGRRVDRKLSLLRVDIDAEEQVDNDDERLSVNHALPEVPWAAHCART